MSRYVLRDGHLVPKHLASPLSRPKVSSLPRPMVISDAMPALQSMADGKFYESKAAMRAATKAAGCEEVGNDSSLFRPYAPPPDNESPSGEQMAALWDQHVGA